MSDKTKNPLTKALGDIFNLKLSKPKGSSPLPQAAGLASGSTGLFGELVCKYKLSVETLTEQQLAEAIRQAIASGDFIRNITTDGRQTVIYIPWREVERLRTRYNELLDAVTSKHEGETRHETALRYIKDSENRTEGSLDS